MNIQDKDALDEKGLISELDMAAYEYAIKMRSSYGFEKMRQDAFIAGAEWQSSTNQPSTIESDVEELALINCNKYYAHTQGLEQVRGVAISSFKDGYKAANKEQGFSLDEIGNAFTAGIKWDCAEFAYLERGIKHEVPNKEEYIAQLKKEKPIGS